MDSIIFAPAEKFHRVSRQRNVCYYVQAWNFFLLRIRIVRLHGK